MLTLCCLLASCSITAHASDPQDSRMRARDLGIVIGTYATGPLNAITDVAGVKVGHTTLISGDGPLKPGVGPVRTGVTVVIPRDDVWHKKVPAGSFVLNGTGEFQVRTHRYAPQGRRPGCKLVEPHGHLSALPPATLWWHAPAWFLIAAVRRA